MRRRPHKLSPIALLDGYTLWCLRMPGSKGLLFSLAPLLVTIAVLCAGILLASALS